MKLIRLIPLFGIPLLLIACQNPAAQNASANNAKQEVAGTNATESTEANTRSYTQEEIDEANSLLLPVEELSRFTEEMKSRRKANLILAEYVVPHDSVYVLEISEEEASKMGVDPEYYRAAIKDIETADSLYLELVRERKATRHPLKDFREEVRELKNKQLQK